MFVAVSTAGQLSHLSVLGQNCIIAIRSAVDIAVNYMIRSKQDTGISFLNEFLKPKAQSFIGKNGLADYVKQLHMTVIDILKEVYKNSIAV